MIGPTRRTVLRRSLIAISTVVASFGFNLQPVDSFTSGWGPITNLYIGDPPVTGYSDQTSSGSYKASAISCAYDPLNTNVDEKRFVAIYARPDDSAWPSRYSQMAPKIRQALYNASGYLDHQADLNPAGANVRRSRQQLKILCEQGTSEPVVHNVTLTGKTNAAVQLDPRAVIKFSINANPLYNRPNEKYIVFYDAYIGNGTEEFGTGENCHDPNSNNDERPDVENCNNKRDGLYSFYAIDFRDKYTTEGPNWHTYLHEMSHTMGAVQAGALRNNSVPGVYFSHCTDDEDVMCYNEEIPDDPATPGNEFLQAKPRSTGACPAVKNAPASPSGLAPTANLGRYDCGQNDYFNPDPRTLPSGDQYLANNWNIAAEYNEYVHHSTVGMSTFSGSVANGNSSESSSSADGAYVAFDSHASNLVSGDTNGASDIFIRRYGKTSRISLRDGGYSQANGASMNPSISGDDRYIVFESTASDLVSNDVNGYRDIFIRDKSNASTKRVSLHTSGVAGNEESRSPVVSDGGRYVAFFSEASNLVAADTNGTGDVFLRDLQLNTTTRISVASDGSQGCLGCTSHYPSMSPDGRYVAFQSLASLVPGDTNNARDIFVWDRLAPAGSQITRVSVTTSGGEGAGSSYYPVISSDGRFVAFESTAANLVSGDTNGHMDVFLWDRFGGAGNQVTRVSVGQTGVQANGISYSATMSGDGRLVGFESAASNLVPNDSNATLDVFVWDRLASGDKTQRVSRSWIGNQANGPSMNSALSRDGREIFFESPSSILVPGDTNPNFDIFRHSVF